MMFAARLPLPALSTKTVLIVSTARMSKFSHLLRLADHFWWRSVPDGVPLSEFFYLRLVPFPLVSISFLCFFYFKKLTTARAHYLLIRLCEGVAGSPREGLLQLVYTTATPRTYNYTLRLQNWWRSYGDYKSHAKMARVERMLTPPNHNNVCWGFPKWIVWNGEVL